MRRSRFVSLCLFAGLSFVGLLPGPAAAQELNNFGPQNTWTSLCEIDRLTDEKSCRLFTYKQYENGRELEYMALSLVPTDGGYNLILTTTEGLVDNCALRVGANPRLESGISTINMCMFASSASNLIIEQFKTGLSLLVRANFAGKGKRDVDFSLAGFTSALEAMQTKLR